MKLKLLPIALLAVVGFTLAGCTPEASSTSQPHVTTTTTEEPTSTTTTTTDPGPSVTKFEISNKADLTAEWHVEDALISINKNTNDIDNTLDPNKPADLAKMSLLTDRFTQVSLREEGSDLVFYNEGGAAVTEVMYIWVPVSVEHKWGVWEYYAPIKLNPNPSTAGE